MRSSSNISPKKRDSSIVKMNGFKKMQGFSEVSIGNLVTLFVGLINIILNRIKGK